MIERVLTSYANLSLADIAGVAVAITAVVAVIIAYKRYQFDLRIREEERSASLLAEKRRLISIGPRFEVKTTSGSHKGIDFRDGTFEAETKTSIRIRNIGGDAYSIAILGQHHKEISWKQNLLPATVPQGEHFNLEFKLEAPKIESKTVSISLWLHSIDNLGRGQQQVVSIIWWKWPAESNAEISISDPASSPYSGYPENAGTNWLLGSNAVKANKEAVGAE